MNGNFASQNKFKSNIFKLTKFYAPSLTQSSLFFLFLYFVIFICCLFGTFSAFESNIIYCEQSSTVDDKNWYIEENLKCSTYILLHINNPLVLPQAHGCYDRVHFYNGCSSKSSGFFQFGINHRTIWSVTSDHEIGIHALWKHMQLKHVQCMHALHVPLILCTCFVYMYMYTVLYSA